jgi:hypothetical protein
MEKDKIKHTNKPGANASITAFIVSIVICRVKRSHKEEKHSFHKAIGYYSVVNCITLALRVTQSSNGSWGSIF